MTRSPRGPLRIVLFALLAVAVVVLGVVIAALIPILTHQSAGGSGQLLPEGYVSEVSATGEDGRTRVLRAETPDGKPAELGSITPGQTLVVSSEGFNADIGIYLAICGIPASPDEKPGPCLGGVPEGAETGGAAGDEGLSSAWITDAWAWRAFATQGYNGDGEGAFVARLTVPDPVVDGFDCRVNRCAIATRADHTAGADRVQDMQLPVAFAE